MCVCASVEGVCVCLCSWYFGEMTEETASAILKESELTNSFVVFCEAEGGTFTLSMRWGCV